MSMFAALTEKPWLMPGTATDAAVADGRKTAAIGLGLFVTVVGFLFVLITATYFMRMGGHGALGHGTGDWHSFPKPPLLWVNTAVLALSSLGWHAARRGVIRRNGALLRWGLIAGGVLALLFIAGQLLVWRQLQADGYFLSAGRGFCLVSSDPLAEANLHFMTGNPAIAFFYLITALHGLHLLGGMIVWGRTTARVLGGAEIAVVRQPVILCGRYWHFLLLVWLAMFGLLLMT